VKTNRKSGFSLVELLMVLAIVALISALVIPAATSTMMGSRLSGAANQVLSTLTSARQTAIVHNRTVEVRFYQFGDPETPGENPAKPETGRYRATQTFEYDEHGAALPVTQVERLPDGIVLDSNIKLSTIFDPQQAKTFTPPLDAPAVLPRGVGTNYACSAFQFTPSGSTKLGFGNWFVTLHRLTDGDNLAAPPSNYASVQVEAISGAVKIYRP
jgi:uncharacterized protein (TIGR02596 family)